MNFQQGSPTLKVLHLADIHWDPEYLEGSLANCHDKLCCRGSSGTVTNQADAAGYWGDYRDCDSPWRTVDKAMAHMARQHPVNIHQFFIKCILLGKILIQD